MKTSTHIVHVGSKTWCHTRDVDVLAVESTRKVELRRAPPQFKRQQKPEHVVLRQKSLNLNIRQMFTPCKAKCVYWCWVTGKIEYSIIDCVLYAWYVGLFHD